jgi:hypothetical protein
MAVRAEQDALAGLVAGAGDRSRHSAMAQREGLFAGYHVVELECPEAPAVATYSAGSSRLFNEDSLDSSAAPGYSLGAALDASIASAAAASELGPPVVWTIE